MAKLFLRLILSTQSRSALLTAVAVALLLLSVQPLCFAQTHQGAITGVVQDSSGAGIANASFAAPSLDPGLILQTKSNSSGVFVLSPLKIGNYSLSASSPGFQTIQRDNLHLDIQQRLNV